MKRLILTSLIVLPFASSATTFTCKAIQKGRSILVAKNLQSKLALMCRTKVWRWTWVVKPATRFLGWEKYCEDVRHARRRDCRHIHRQWEWAYFRYAPHKQWWTDCCLHAQPVLWDVNKGVSNHALYICSTPTIKPQRAFEPITSFAIIISTYICSQSRVLNLYYPVSKQSPYKTTPTQRQNAASPCLKRLIFYFGTAIILILSFET